MGLRVLWEKDGEDHVVWFNTSSQGAQAAMAFINALHDVGLVGSLSQMTTPSDGNYVLYDTVNQDLLNSITA